MTTLAEISGLSLSQLNRQFKLFFDNPSAIYSKMRLEHVIELLEDDFSITEISSKCAYADPKALCRKFKEMTNDTQPI